MKIVKEDGKTLTFLPTWRLLITVGMHCASAIQFGAWVIFTIEQKQIHLFMQICLIAGATIAMLLGHFIGKKDLRRVRNSGALLEGTPFQIGLVISCVAAVPGSLLVLVLVS